MKLAKPQKYKKRNYKIKEDVSQNAEKLNDFFI